MLTKKIINDQGEELKKSGYIFLENNVSPTSNTGEGIDRGVFCITNKRLFFIKTGEGKDQYRYSGLIDVASFVANIFVPGDTIDRIGRALSNEFKDAISLGIQTYSNKKMINEYTTFDQVRYDLNIPIEQIVSCKKVGKPRDIQNPLYNPFKKSNWKKYWLDDPQFKNHYLELRLREENVTTNYCIYSNNPRDPDNISNIVNLNKWVNEITNAI